MTVIPEVIAQIEAHICEYVKDSHTCGCMDVGCRGRHAERDALLDDIEENLLPELVAILRAAPSAASVVEGAPERIWATAYFNQNRSEHVQAWSVSGFDDRQQVEYTRANLAPTGNAALVEAAFLLGFMASSERYNGEYPCPSHGYENDAYWCAMRDRPLKSGDLAVAVKTPAEDVGALVEALTRYNAAAGGGMEIDRFGDYVRFDDFNAALAKHKGGAA